MRLWTRMVVVVMSVAIMLSVIAATALAGPCPDYKPRKGSQTTQSA